MHLLGSHKLHFMIFDQQLYKFQKSFREEIFKPKALERVSLSEFVSTIDPSFIRHYNILD